MTDSSPASTMTDPHEQFSMDGFSSPLSSPPSSMPSTPKSFATERSIKDTIEHTVENTIQGIVEDVTENGTHPSQVHGKKRKRNDKTTKLLKPTQPNPYYGNQQLGKPLPYGKPLIHAEKRQQLCETLPWYKAYQSGAYTSGGVAMGFLCDKEVGDRDYFGDQIMIARVGGGKGPDPAGTGKNVQVTSQDVCKIAMAFRESKRIVKPIGVIAGQGNTGSPTALPNYYNVLGWFHVTDVWCETYGGYSRWMVRLEKINLDEKSWWSAKDTSHARPNFTSPKAPVITCSKCKKDSKLIYKQGWTCLNSDPEPARVGNKLRERTTCTEFFKFGKDIDDKTLEFTKEFLQERTNFKELRNLDKLKIDPGPLAPPLLTMADVKRLGDFGFEEECKRGIVCPVCGCCSRRVNWGKWVCESSNDPCKSNRFIHELPTRVIPAERAISEDNEVPQSMMEDKKPKHFVDPYVTHDKFNWGAWEVFQYGFRDKRGIDGEPGAIIGFGYHLKSSHDMNKLPSGPDELFEELQKVDLGLKRSPSKCPGSISEVLTAHWATNWGAPYKYRVAQESKSFKVAPPVIIKALKRLTWAGQKSVAQGGEQFGKFSDFNEMLSVGYFEKSYMGYHDDGEKTLGPTVASISLGCSSTMHWRPKSNNNIRAKNDKCMNQKGTKRDVLKIVLEHGDIMIMHGARIQELYEHCVNPCGKLRFALTCRYIDPAEIRGKKESESAEKAGQLPEGSEQYDYDFNGDMRRLSAMCALPPKEKTQVSPEEGSLFETSTSQGFHHEYEFDGMQTSGPSSQAAETNFRPRPASFLPQTNGGSEQHGHLFHESAPSPFEHAAEKSLARTEHQEYKSISAPMNEVPAVQVQEHQTYRYGLEFASMTDQTHGMYQIPAQQYFNQNSGYASTLSQAHSMYHHPAQQYFNNNSGYAPSWSHIPVLHQHPAHQYNSYDSVYEPARSANPSAYGEEFHYQAQKYYHDDFEATESVPSDYPLEGLE